eukprot:5938484-Amphidinium_carterae.1
MNEVWSWEGDPKVGMRSRSARGVCGAETTLVGLQVGQRAFPHGFEGQLGLSGDLLAFPDQSTK